MGLTLQHMNYLAGFEARRLLVERFESLEVEAEKLTLATG